MNGLNNTLDTFKERIGELKDRSDEEKNGKSIKVHCRQNRGHGKKL